MPPTAALAAALVVWAQTAGAKRLDTTNPAQRHAVISAADPRAGSSSLHLGRQLVPAFGQGPQLTPQGATSALANVSNQIHSLGNATEGSGNAANVIEIAGKIAAAAGRVASELPANSEDAAGLMEAVKTAKGAVAASDALLGAAAFVESKEWEAVTTTAAVPPSFEGTTLGQFPPSSPPPPPPAAPPPPGPPLLEPAGEDGNTEPPTQPPLSLSMPSAPRLEWNDANTIRADTGAADLARLQEMYDACVTGEPVKFPANSNSVCDLIPFATRPDLIPNDPDCGTDGLCKPCASSTKAHSSCSQYSRANFSKDTQNTVTTSFSAEVDHAPGGCCSANSCVGSYTESQLVSAEAGQRVYFDYKASYRTRPAHPTIVPSCSSPPCDTLCVPASLCSRACDPPPHTGACRRFLDARLVRGGRRPIR